MADAFKIKSDPKQFIKELQKVHGQMEQVAVNVLNKSAELIQGEYKRKIKSDFVTRGNFTENAVKIFKATSTGSGGQLREMKNINAKVYVPELRGGDHYLKDHEFGETKKGATSTKGSIATPTDKSRVGDSYKGRVKRAGDLRKIGKIQNLKIKGKNIEDLFSLKKNQIWAVLHKFRKKAAYGWDLRKAFYLFGNVHIFGKNRFPMLRKLDQRTRKLKTNPNFTESVEMVGTQAKLEEIFIREARKLIR